MRWKLLFSWTTFSASHIFHSCIILQLLSKLPIFNLPHLISKYWTSTIKLFVDSFKRKLECLVLSVISTLVRYLQARLEPIRPETLIGNCSKGRLALPEDNTLGWKRPTVRNTLAYFVHWVFLENDVDTF